MTNGELIEKLSQYDSKLEVTIKMTSKKDNEYLRKLITAIEERAVIIDRVYRREMSEIMDIIANAKDLMAASYGDTQ